MLSQKYTGDYFGFLLNTTVSPLILGKSLTPKVGALSDFSVRSKAFSKSCWYSNSKFCLPTVGSDCIFCSALSVYQLLLCTRLYQTAQSCTVQGLAQELRGTYIDCGTKSPAPRDSSLPLFLLSF